MHKNSAHTHTPEPAPSVRITKVTPVIDTTPGNT
jgi:hypothetical protein